MLVLALLQLTVAQVELPPVAVMLSSKRPGAEAVSPKVATLVFEVLQAEGFSRLMDDATAKQAARDARLCQGAKVCLREVAAAIAPGAVVVGVDVGQIGKSLAIHIEAVGADTDDTLAMADIAATASDFRKSAEAPLTAFGSSLKTALSRPKAPPLATLDVPTKEPEPPALVPAPTAPTEVSRSSRLEGKKLTGAVFAGGAVVTAAVAIGFGIASATAKSEFERSLITLPDGTQGSTLTAMEAQAVAQRSNTGALVALTSAIVSAGLTAAATALLVPAP